MGSSASQLWIGRHNPTVAVRFLQKEPEMTIEFNVEGMSCQHCVSAVTNAIRERDAAARVQIDLAAGKVTVESAAPVETLKDAIDDAGYTVVAVANP
jgi:copper chaperone